jgi:hypothetical protein
MQTAGARALREDDQLTRPRAKRFERAPLRPVGRLERPPQAERRTVTITGQPVPPRRRPSPAQRHIAAQPDRVALWAFLLGLFLVLVAAATAL